MPNIYVLSRVVLRCTTFFLAGLVISSCGTMRFDETHYYAIPQSDNVNIYRLKVQGFTVLSDAKYQSGWYPTNAVDSLFGNVRSGGGADELQARKEIENITRTAIIASTKAYNAVALNPASTEADIAKAMQVRRRVLAYPLLNENIPTGSRIIDYNPARGVAVRHIDEKMVFILSANPDVVVGNIKNFAESDKTSLSIINLAKVVSQRVRNKVVAAEAKSAVDKRFHKLVEAQIADAIVSFEKEVSKSTYTINDKNKIIEEANILLKLLEGAPR